jgi:hypothetical protein
MDISHLPYKMTVTDEVEKGCRPIAKKFRRCLQDVRVKRRADIASDHHLLVARLRLKLMRNWTGKTINFSTTT